ncbi:opsin 8, group member c [Platichthys flesus]|uniref:opsin 8, group member c n=1 Tax=Platichthys flesus TaxID=8260 RepID=UPI002DB7CB39|nr:opsin 8, group member c [Platichthys flesus]
MSLNENITEFTSKLSPAADACVGLAILSVVLLSVLGNGLVLVICYRRRKKMVGSELLCVNLALVDFLCCICFYPLSVMSSFHHSWLGGNVTCVYYGFGCFIFGLCGMFTVAAISVTRYLKTCHSLLHTVQSDRASIRMACCATWVVATVWSSLPLFGWGEYVPEPYGLSCTIAWRGYHTSAKDAFYVICTFAIFTLVPILLIVVSQCQILNQVSSFTDSMSARGIHNNLRRTEKRLSMMFFCISLGFVIAWAPYAVVSFLFIFHKEHRYMAPGGFVFPALFAKSSHIYNPLIYFYFNKTFQRELRYLLLSIYSKLGVNQVGVHIGAGHQAPIPIHIQLQERGCVPKRNFSLSQDRTHSKTKSKEKVVNADGSRLVYVCWGSTYTDSNNKPANDCPPVSI